MTMIGKPFQQAAAQPGESSADHRTRLALQQAEALEQRRRDLAEQTSSVNSAAVRIKIWEQLHQITLPRSATHPVLRIIAGNTDLSLDDVRAEQRSRAHGAKAVNGSE